MMKKLLIIVLLVPFQLLVAKNFVITNIYEKPIFIAIGDSKNDPLKAQIIKINPRETFRSQVNMEDLPSFMVAPFESVPGDRVFLYEFKLPRPTISDEMYYKIQEAVIKAYKPIFVENLIDKKLGFTEQSAIAFYEKEIEPNPEKNAELNNLIKIEINKLVTPAQSEDIIQKFIERLEDKNIILEINFQPQIKKVEIKEKKNFLYEGKEYSEDQIKQLLKRLSKDEFDQIIEEHKIKVKEKDKTPLVVSQQEPVISIPSRSLLRKIIGRGIAVIPAENFQMRISPYPICYECEALKILAHIHGYDFINATEYMKILGLSKKNLSKENIKDSYQSLKNSLFYLRLSGASYFEHLFYYLMQIIQNAYERLSGEQLPEEEKELQFPSPKTKEKGTQTTEPQSLRKAPVKETYFPKSTETAESIRWSEEAMRKSQAPLPPTRSTTQPISFKPVTLPWNQ